MTRKLKIILRVNILYLLCFRVIIAAYFCSSLIKDLKEGFKEGIESTRIKQRYNLISDIPLQRNIGVYETFIRQDSSVSLDARTTAVDIRISGAKAFAGPTISSMLISIFGMLCYLAILIIVLIMLILLRKSIRSGNIFTRDNIGFMRAIGILLIVASLLSDLGRYLEIQTLTELLKGTKWQLSENIFSFRDIFMGVIVLIIAEIFSIGHDIAEDQELTI